MFLTTRADVGKSRVAGVEVVANGRFTRELTYNINGNAYWPELDGRGAAPAGGCGRLGRRRAART